MPLPSIYEFETYREYLSAWFDAKREEKKHYTHRRFAEEAGQANVGILALLLSGRRGLTPNLILAIRKPLALNEPEAAFLTLLCEKEDAEQALAVARERLARTNARAVAREPRAPRPSFEERRQAKTSLNAASSAADAVRDAEEALRAVRQELSARRAIQRAELLAAERLRVLSHWSTAALSQLALCRGFRDDPAWAARALEHRERPETLAEGLRLLAELGALPRPAQAHPERGQQGAPPMLTSDSVPAGDVRSYYEGVYGQAGRALEAHFDPARPEQQARALLGGLTVAIPSAEIPRFRALIQDVQHQIFAFLEGLEGERDIVYQLYLHLFPLSAPDPDGAPAAVRPPG